MYFGTPQNRENGVFGALLYNCVLATVKKKEKKEEVVGLSRRGCHRSDNIHIYSITQPRAKGLACHLYTVV